MCDILLSQYLGVAIPYWVYEFPFWLISVWVFTIWSVVLMMLITKIKWS